MAQGLDGKGVPEWTVLGLPCRSLICAALPCLLVL